MNYRKQEKKTQLLALVLALLLHTMLLLCAYYILFRPVGSGTTAIYRIQRSRFPIQDPIAKQDQENPLPIHNPVQEAPKQVIATSPIGSVAVLESEEREKGEPTLDQKDLSEELKQPPTPPELPLPQEQETQSQAIDERSLYQENETKQTGASLELVGWIWDTVPQPQDSTPETGKIVFEITIDDLGEVIAVKTLEKTISPLAEQIYKDAVTKLTFSKKNPNQVYLPKSIGKVSFLIKAR